MVRQIKINHYTFVTHSPDLPLYLDISKSIISPNCALYLTNLNHSQIHYFQIYILYIRYPFVTLGTVFGQIKINHHTFITHLPQWALYLNKSKSIITHSLHIRHIGLGIGQIKITHKFTTFESI